MYKKDLDKTGTIGYLYEKQNECFAVHFLSLARKLAKLANCMLMILKLLLSQTIINIEMQ